MKNKINALTVTFICIVLLHFASPGGITGKIAHAIMLCVIIYNVFEISDNLTNITNDKNKDQKE